MQLVPEPFVEISVEHAAEKDIKGGDRLKSVPHVAVQGWQGVRCLLRKAMVPKRIKPLTLAGSNKPVYPVGIPIHWAYSGLPDGGVGWPRNGINVLSPTAIDPNAYTPEFKAILVKIDKV